MNLITCTTEVNPCPVADQLLLSLSDALDPLALGVDAETIAYVFSAGAAAVIAGWVVGYGAAIAIEVIRKI